MSEVLAKAVEALAEKIGGRSFPASARIVIRDEGALRIDAAGVTIDDSDADVTLTADLDTFHGMMTGDVNPTTAFMTGRLRIDGDMGLAMKLGSLLA